MEGPIVELVLYPRYTGLVGPGEYPTVPVDVSAYGSAVVEAWRGALVGGGTTPVASTFLLRLQVSHDAVAWETVKSASTAGATTVWDDLALRHRWLRAVVTLTADSDDDVAIAVYVTGTLTKRVP